MLGKYTDLALEVHELHGEDSGITVNEKIINGTKITFARIFEGEGEKLSGKSAGKYINIDVGKVWMTDSVRFREIAKTVSSQLKELIPNGEGCVLVIGLGNIDITPDSLGPQTSKRLLITRHIKDLDPDLYNTTGFGCLSTLSVGVLGQTGIESAEIIKSAVKQIRPKCVILVDSLASRRLSRLATTIQISDSGISPGAGVLNKRAELNKTILGVPVVSVGVPMVVDGATLAHDLLEEHIGDSRRDFQVAINKTFNGQGREMFVTPKDIDKISRIVSRLVASAINLAVHNMDLEEINEYIEP